MMETSNTVDGTLQSFSSSFFDALMNTLTETSGSPWLIADVPTDGVTPDGVEPVRVKLTVEGGIRGSFLIEFDRAEATILARALLRQPSEEFGEQQLEALLNLVKTATSKFSSALEPKYGTLRIKSSSTSKPASDLLNVVKMTAADNGGSRVSILMYPDPALREALSLHANAEGKGAITPGSMSAAGVDAVSEPVNLNLVMDIELNVTLRFGQRQLTLREVLELTSGSVIELDRQVEEPIELLLEGKVIARGEAVVIDGNYGLRVTEVPQPLPQPITTQVPR